LRKMREKPAEALAIQHSTKRRLGKSYISRLPRKIQLSCGFIVAECKRNGIGKTGKCGPAEDSECERARYKYSTEQQ